MNEIVTTRVVNVFAASTILSLTAACAPDSVLAPRDHADVPANATLGVSTPGVSATAVVTVSVEGQRVARSAPRAPHSGTCNADGSWTHATGSKTNPWVTTGAWNGVCTDITAGQYITVTFSETANYVAPPSGNKQLNFADLCTDPNDPATCTKRGVHYKKNQNETVGFGTLVSTSAIMCTEPNGGGTCTDAGLWTVDLSQLSAAAFDVFTLPHDGVGGWLITAHSATSGDHPGYLAW